MKNFWVKRQREIGITLIILGIILLVSVTVYLYSRNSGIKGFAQFVPDKDVVLYFEFPAALDNGGAVAKKINSAFNIDWDKNIAPLVDKKGAFALIRNPDNKKLLPLFFFKIKSQENVLSFLSSFKKLPEDSEIAFLDDSTLLIASALYKPSTGARLSENKDFIKLQQNLSASWFVYANTKDFNPEIENLISQAVPFMPFTLPVFTAVGVSAENFNGIWQGHSYAINNNDILVKNEQAYRALLLPFLPPDFDIIISGQNFPSQIAKMDFLSKEQVGQLSASDFLSALKKQHLESARPSPDVRRGEAKQLMSQLNEANVGTTLDFEKLFSKEFAVAVNGDKILTIAELAERDQENQIAFLHDTFMKNAGDFIVQAREVKLPDGTKAKEFITVETLPKTFQENFYGIKINGILFNDKKTIYGAVTQGKIFISNDLTVIKKSLLLTRERGLNFRETAAYRQFFQPIFKNPELAGIAVSEFGTVSFSKRMFSDHMETSFMVQAEPQRGY